MIYPVDSIFQPLNNNIGAILVRAWVNDYMYLLWLEQNLFPGFHSLGYIRFNILYNILLLFIDELLFATVSVFVFSRSGKSIIGNYLVSRNVSSSSKFFFELRNSILQWLQVLRRVVDNGQLIQGSKKDCLVVQDN